MLSIVNKIRNLFHGLAGVLGLLYISSQHSSRQLASSGARNLICLAKRIEFQIGFESKKDELSEG